VDAEPFALVLPGVGALDHPADLAESGAVATPQPQMSPDWPNGCFGCFGRESFGALGLAWGYGLTERVFGEDFV
jgi:hypothetical protein